MQKSAETNVNVNQKQFKRAMINIDTNEKNIVVCKPQVNLHSLNKIKKPIADIPIAHNIYIAVSMYTTAYISHWTLPAWIGSVKLERKESRLLAVPLKVSIIDA